MTSTLYNDIGTLLFSRIVLNNDQWSVSLVLDSNELTSTDNYQQRVVKQLAERRQCVKQQREQIQENLSAKETVIQPNYRYHLLIAQKKIRSLQERLQSQQGI